MAKYVLRPQQILPQVSLRDALWWIAFGYYPTDFIDKDSLDYGVGFVEYFDTSRDRQWWENFGKRDYEEEDLKKYSDLVDDAKYIIRNLPKNYIDLIDNATHRFFAVFTESKIKLYGITPEYYKSKQEYLDVLEHSYEVTNEYLIKEGMPADEIPKEDLLLADSWETQIRNIAPEEIFPSKVKFSDFNWDDSNLKTENSTYRELVVSTDDLFKLYPLEFTQSQKVQLGANNYFIDTSDNNEIQINETRGRKSKLSPEQISETTLFAKTFLDTNDNVMNKVLIHKCIDWAFEKFDILVPETTIRDYLKPLTRKSEK